MTASGPIRLLIVDDHPIVREGLPAAFSNQPDFDVIGEAGDGEEAITRVTELRPEVGLMDLRMAKLDGVTAIRRLLQADRQLPILVLTTFDSDTDVLPAVEAGTMAGLVRDPMPCRFGEAALPPLEQLRRRAAPSGAREGNRTITVTGNVRSATARQPAAGRGRSAGFRSDDSLRVSALA